MRNTKKQEKNYVFKRKKQFWTCKTDGFTYVETIAVLAICAILSAGTIASASRLIYVAKKNAAESQISQYSTALQIYFLDCGRFPTSEQGINALWEKPELFPVPENWNGPYLERKPKSDPWGTDYKYYSRESEPLPASAPEKLPYVLISYGADGKEGGEGESCDIVSWK